MDKATWQEYIPYRKLLIKCQGRAEEPLTMGKSRVARPPHHPARTVREPRDDGSNGVIPSRQANSARHSRGGGEAKEGSRGQGVDVQVGRCHNPLQSNNK